MSWGVSPWVYPVWDSLGFLDIIVENFPKMGKEIITQVQETQRVPNRIKAKHPKTHINQISKDQTQRTTIKSSKGKTANNTQGDSHKDNS